MRSSERPFAPGLVNFLRLDKCSAASRFTIPSCASPLLSLGMARRATPCGPRHAVPELSSHLGLFTRTRPADARNTVVCTAPLRRVLTVRGNIAAARSASNASDHGAPSAAQARLVSPAAMANLTPDALADAIAAGQFDKVLAAVDGGLSKDSCLVRLPTACCGAGSWGTPQADWPGVKNWRLHAGACGAGARGHARCEQAAAQVGSCLTLCLLFSLRCLACRAGARCSSRQQLPEQPSSWKGC